MAGPAKGQHYKKADQRYNIPDLYAADVTDISHNQRQQRTPNYRHDDQTAGILCVIPQIFYTEWKYGREHDRHEKRHAGNRN